MIKEPLNPLVVAVGNKLFLLCGRPTEFAVVLCRLFHLQLGVGLIKNMEVKPEIRNGKN